MSKSKSGRGEPMLELHTYLHRRVQELPEVTNVKIAAALGYEKPNVVTMMLNGSMKVPLNKVPELARVLELDPLALLRRAMGTYSPEWWAVIEKLFGEATPLTVNERKLLLHIREHLAERTSPCWRTASSSVS